MSKPDDVRSAAESQLGSPYVYGTWGQLCTPALRKKYVGYNPSQKKKTYNRCQVLRAKDPKPSCYGCKFQGDLAFDCRGFTWWLLQQAGITISGQSVATQWSTAANWAERGDATAMPDLVCCVFIREKDGKWSHTGMHVGGGEIIHCSGEVKRDRIGGKRAWSHYAIPAGLYTTAEIEKAHKERGLFMRTLKKGSQGEDVRALQEMLTAMGYDVGAKNGKADGIFGPKTETAVKAFQSRNGLAATGIADPETLDAIAARAADPDVPELPEDDDEHETPSAIIPLTYAEAIAIRDSLKKALSIIELALQ